MDADPSFEPTAAGLGTNVGSRWEETDAVLRLAPTGRQGRLTRLCECEQPQPAGHLRLTVALS
jgi:hypothetical protein